MAHALTNMIRDVNNFISDSNRSIKKTFSFTINEEPSTAYILGAVSVGIIGAMIYRSNGNGIESLSTTASETIVPFSSSDSAPETPIDTPLLNEPTEDTLLTQPFENSQVDNMSSPDIYNMDKSPNDSLDTENSTIEPISNSTDENESDTNITRRRTQIPAEDDLL